MKGILVIVLAVAVFAGCRKPQAFDYREVKNFRIDKLDLNQTFVSMDLVFFNPNNYGINLKKVNLDIYVDNNYIGKYLLDTTIKISKKSEFVLPSTVQVDMNGIFKNALNVLLGQEVVISIKGMTKAGKAGLYINVPIHYESRQKFNFF